MILNRKAGWIFVLSCMLAGATFSEEAKRYAAIYASYWRTGTLDWICSYELLPYLTEWDGHPRIVEEKYISNANPANDPRVLTNRTRMISEIEAALPVGEELDFLLFQDQSEWAAISMVGSNGVQDHIDKAVGWGKVAQGVSTSAVTVMHVTWARPRPHSVYASGGAFDGLGPSNMQAEVNDTYEQSVQAINDDPDAGSAFRTHTGEAWGQKDWTNGLYRNWGSNHHANVRGDILATLQVYTAIYRDDASDIYSQNSDISKPDFSNPNQPKLTNGSNGTNDVIDLLMVVNGDLEQAPDSVEYLYPLTTNDWHELAYIADYVTFTGGDANTDDLVDTNDLAHINANLGTTSGAIWRDGDFNGDGAVDQTDLDIYYAASRFLQTSVSSLNVPEGSTNQFSVRLTSRPAATSTVTVSRTSGDTDISVQSGSSLTFTTNNWNTYQPVTLAAAPDDLDYTNGTAIIRCELEGLDIEYLTATEIDDDEDPVYALPWDEPFEDSGDNAVTNGSLAGQHGWIGGGTVQSGTVFAGTQALSLTYETASHTFLGSATNISITLQINPVLSEIAPETIPTGASAVFYVNTNRQLVAYSNETSIVIESPLFSNGWNKIAVTCDFVSKVWNLELNDIPMVGNFAFHGNPSSFQGLELTDGSTNTTFFDSITVSSTSDESDEDADGLPDSWELTHYGSTNVNPSAMASNGVNTVLETYIAGLNPTNPQSAFLISDLSPLTSGNVLSWNTTNGRVYSVYWASNLLSGFQPLESNIAYTAVPFTDTNHPAEQKGFYKIEVELE